MKLSQVTALAMLLLVSAGAAAYEKGEWFLRAGVATVAPDASSDPLSLDGAAVAGSGADVDNGTALSLMFGYMLTDHWAIEVLGSSPFSHDIDANTGALGLGTVAAGETRHLPPTVSLQYWFADAGSRWQPYVGAGINYTIFFRRRRRCVSLKAYWAPGSCRSIIL